MNWRHDPRLVRMLIADQSWHCEVHGRLLDDEVVELAHRLGMTTEDVLGTEIAIRQSPVLRLRVVIMDLLLRLSRPKCEPLA